MYAAHFSRRHERAGRNGLSFSIINQDKDKDNNPTTPTEKLTSQTSSIPSPPRPKQQSAYPINKSTLHPSISSSSPPHLFPQLDLEVRVRLPWPSADADVHGRQVQGLEAVKPKLVALWQQELVEDLQNRNKGDRQVAERWVVVGTALTWV